ncbi:Ancient ubiquitous protein 1, partial [Ophiophagus hannah]
GGNPPLLLFPEEETTNGRVGLLRFRWARRGLGEPGLHRLAPPNPPHPPPLPFAAPGPSPLWTRCSRWLCRAWLALPGSLSCSGLSSFLSPFIKWLPSVYRQAEESQEEFALRVQEVGKAAGEGLLALELGVMSTCLTAADKAEHLKRLRHHPPASRPPPPPSQSSGSQPQVSRSVPPTEDVHLIGMARRVREVLPQVPMSAIRKDLAQTNCVDTTIANLLEGRVPFVPEAETEGFVAAAPSSYGAQDPSTSRMAPVQKAVGVCLEEACLGRFLKGSLFSLGIGEGLCQICGSQTTFSPGTKASALGLRQK